MLEAHNNMNVVNHSSTFFKRWAGILAQITQNNANEYFSLGNRENLSNCQCVLAYLMNTAFL